MFKKQIVALLTTVFLPYLPLQKNTAEMSVWSMTLTMT
jgi:hypothetical protein